MPTRQTQQGFTMIELIVVIVILGVLAATALPKFIDLRGDAEQAAVDGVAGAAASAMNLNYSACAISSNKAVGNCQKVDACSDTTSLMQAGLSTAYTFAPNAAGVDIGTTDGATPLCKVSKTVGAKTYTQTFTGIAAGNAP